MFQKRNGTMRPFRAAPSLVDLCVKVAIDNVKYLGDVGETDLHLLERILPHCTKDQLIHVEDSTVVRWITNELFDVIYWVGFFLEPKAYPM